MTFFRNGTDYHFNKAIPHKMNIPSFQYIKRPQQDKPCCDRLMLIVVRPTADYYHCPFNR